MKHQKMEPMLDIKALEEKRPEKVTRFSLDKSIDNMVGALYDPIIVHRCAWGTSDIIPEWLRTQITLDRLLELMVAQKEGREPMGTDSEALAYLIPACLEFPFSHDWAQIYLYLGCKVYEKGRTPTSGVTFPDDIRVEKLDRNQEEDLQRLKHWIYETKLKHRAGRRQEIKQEIKKDKKREEEEGKAAQPALFDF